MSDKIDWRTLKIGEHVTVTFDAEVADTGDGFASFGLVGGTIVTTMDAAELDKATITKKEQPLKVGDRVSPVFGTNLATVIAMHDGHVWVEHDKGGPHLTYKESEIKRAKD
jgi:hypothetical protein